MTPYSIPIRYAKGPLDCFIFSQTGINFCWKVFDVGDFYIIDRADQGGEGGAGNFCMVSPKHLGIFLHIAMFAKTRCR